MEEKRTKCEVYSRVVGVLTPVSQWNKGKKEEFNDRKPNDATMAHRDFSDTAQTERPAFGGALAFSAGQAA